MASVPLKRCEDCGEEGFLEECDNCNAELCTTCLDDHDCEQEGPEYPRERIISKEVK